MDTEKLFVGARCVELAKSMHVEEAILILKKHGRGKFKEEVETLKGICDKLTKLEMGIRKKIWESMPKADGASCPIKTEEKK